MMEHPTAEAQDFARWPWLTDEAGRERRVGVELEFAGLGVDTTADLLVELYGGRKEQASHYQVRVIDTEMGDIKVEMDSRFVKERKHRELLETFGIVPDAEVGEAIDDFVLRAATAVVPCEIVTGPLRFEQLPSLERLRDALHLRGAKGTSAEPWYAFGVHFNPSLPSEESRTLYAFLQSFCLLEDWIREDGRVDWSRKMSPFVEPFPESYRDTLLQPGPAPSRRELIETYIRHNPTRNRGLDMLPAFAHLEPELVRQGITDELVKSRPTFHYRLADCRVDEPEWRIAQEWACWVDVEQLAFNDERRLDLIRRGVRAEGHV